MISNYRLAIYACEQADPLLLLMDSRKLSDDPNETYQVNPEAWRKNFIDFHLTEINKIHERHEQSTIVYSTEHFHSRIHHESEVRRLQEFLNQHYENVTIIAYFRRQDRLAVSGHNTAIQGGNQNRFSFPQKQATTNYYDYLSLVQRWSNVFGKENIKVRIFEKDRLIDGDVAKDFKTIILPAMLLERIEKKDLQYERSNPRLSHSALETLLEFNRMPDNDRFFRGASKAELRQPLITALHELKDDFGEILPPKSEALNFYDSFREDNQTLFDTWADGESFGDNFDMFPDENIEVPTVNSKALLKEYSSGIRPPSIVGRLQRRLGGGLKNK